MENWLLCFHMEKRKPSTKANKKQSKNPSKKQIASKKTRNLGTKAIPDKTEAKDQGHEGLWS